MKTIIKYTTIVTFTFFLSISLMAQNPPHPNGGSGPTGGNTPVGGGAPLDGGLTLMLILGGAYAIKSYKKTKSKLN